MVVTIEFYAWNNTQDMWCMVLVYVYQWRRIAGGRVPKCPPVKNVGRQNGRFAPQILAARNG